MGATAKTSKEDWMWQRGITAHPERKLLEEQSLVGAKVGVGDAQKLKNACEGLPMSPPLAHCWEYQVGGMRAIGQWCS